MDQKTTAIPVTITISFFDQDWHKWELVYNPITSLDTLAQDLTRIKEALKAITTEPLTLEVMASL
jgi:hypothetical protein